MKIFKANRFANESVEDLISKLNATRPQLEKILRMEFGADFSVSKFKLSVDTYYAELMILGSSLVESNKFVKVLTEGSIDVEDELSAKLSDDKLVFNRITFIFGNKNRPKYVDTRICPVFDVNAEMWSLTRVK